MGIHVVNDLKDRKPQTPQLSLTRTKDIPTDAQADRIIRLREVVYRVGECKTCIYAKIKTGNFPLQRKLGRKSVGWSSHEIDEYVRITLAGGVYKASDVSPVAGSIAHKQTSPKLNKGVGK